MLVWRHLGTSLTLQAQVWAAWRAVDGHGGWPRDWGVSEVIGSGVFQPPRTAKRAAVLDAWRKHVEELVERDKYSFSSSRVRQCRCVKASAGPVHE